MKLKVLVLVGMSILISESAFATSAPSRGSSSYGSQINIDTGIGASGTGFQEEVVCDPNNSDPGFALGACNNDFGQPAGYDLLLAITSGALDGNSFTVTLPSFTASATGGVGGGYSFGVLECDLNSDGSASGNPPTVVGTTTFCTATQASNSDRTALVPTALFGTAATCVTDLTGKGNGTDSIIIPKDCIASGMTFYFDETNPNVAAAPEPGTLMLFGAGLLVLAGAARRRFQT
jgi:hypothetical protein